MEVQVNVRSDIGEKCIGEYKGKSYIYFTDGNHRWKSLRIPSVANYSERDLSWPLDKYAEAIGCTGWNFRSKHSIYVGFDFDSIVNHKKGLTNEELEEIKTKVQSIPWVTLYSSKSGRGLHLYVFFTSPVPTQSRSDHIALSRAILSNLRGLLNFDFESKVDTCGSILWIWHRNTAPEGLKLLKRGTTLGTIPPFEVAKRTPRNLGTLSYQIKSTSLGPEHQSLINWFANQNTTWWWDEDMGMLVCHTYSLKKAHEELKLRGYYDTVATGKDLPFDQNCFCFPGPNGSWTVRRHNRGTPEHKFWTKDSGGWTKCTYNAYPDLDTAARLADGVKGNNKYSFQTLSELKRFVHFLGVEIEVGGVKETRGPCTVRTVKNEILIQIPREDDDELKGWAQAKGPIWERIFPLDRVSLEVETPDDTVRHVIQGGESLGWMLRSLDGDWIRQNKDNIKSSLITKGVERGIIDQVLGQSILNPWTQVRLPFQPVYPGGRKWNIDAPQLSCRPQEGPHKTWDALLNHVGQGLNDVITHNDWTVRHSLASGADYLLNWIACIFKYPSEPLPYLFLYGPQNSGKSSFHEALSLLFTGGVIPADLALTSQQGFNSELEGAIVCYIEETNLSEHKFAYERIKDWVTSQRLNIHSKGRSPFTVDNTTHWIQCANNAMFCPVLPGDTRIVTLFVPSLTSEIPKLEFMGRLREEAPAFLHTLIKTEVPESNSRLRVPVLVTEEKKVLEDMNKNPLEIFLEDHVYFEPGYVTLLKDFVSFFGDVAGIKESMNYSNRMIARQIPPQYPRGRFGGAGLTHIGNLKLSNGNSKKVKEGKLELVEGKLI